MAYTKFFNGSKVTFKTFKVILTKPNVGWSQVHMSGFETLAGAQAEAQALEKKWGPAYKAIVQAC